MVGGKEVVDLCPPSLNMYTAIVIFTGKVYLYMKEIERAHMPARMWEKIRLSNSYEKALKQVFLITQTLLIVFILCCQFATHFVS